MMNKKDEVDLWLSAGGLDEELVGSIGYVQSARDVGDLYEKVKNRRHDLPFYAKNALRKYDKGLLTWGDFLMEWEMEGMLADYIKG